MYVEIVDVFVLGLPFSNLAPERVLTVKKVRRGETQENGGNIEKITESKQQERKGGPQTRDPSQLSKTWHHSIVVLTRGLLPVLMLCPFPTAKRRAQLWLPISNHSFGFASPQQHILSFLFFFLITHVILSVLSLHISIFKQQGPRSSLGPQNLCG